MRGRRMVGMVLVGAVGLGLAACGDDDASESGSSTSEVLSDRQLDAARDLLGDDCEFLLGGEFQDLAAALTPGNDVDLGETRSDFAGMADRAPDEVKDDLELIADRVAQLDELLDDVDLSDPASYSDPEVQAAIQEASALFDADYQAAAQAVTTFATENCSAPTTG